MSAPKEAAAETKLYQETISPDCKAGVVPGPCKEIPAHEAWLYENETAIGKLRQGIADAKAGKLHVGDDFGQFVTE